MTGGRRLQHLETQRETRRVAIVKKPTRKLMAIDRLDLWFSTGRYFDGLWVGTTESEPYPGLQRIEDALRLIKQYNSLHYSRVIHNIERVWVRLLVSASASYYGPLRACQLDERFVVLETTTLEEIASIFVHEVTHARLERWGFGYDEKERSRIEAVCLRRELNFIATLPRGEPVRDRIARTLEWCESDHDYFSDASFQQRDYEGQVEALRYLGTPDWLVRFLLKLRGVKSAVRRLVRRFVGPRGKRKNVESS
jgi:hypothetical protein